MPTRIDNLTPYAAELLDFGGDTPAPGKGLVWDGEGKLVAADVVVQSDLSAYATISDVTEALATKADASALSSHTGDTDNPHGVTAEQVGAYTTDEVDGLISAITYSDVGAAAAVHTHDDRYYTEAEVDGLIGAITYSDVGAAAAEHGHVISDVTGLQTALDGKANLSGATFIGGVAVKGSLTLNPAGGGLPATEWTLFAAGENAIRGASGVYWTDTVVMVVGSGNAAVEMVSGNLYVSKSISESGQPLRERYTRHFLNLESKDDLTTLPATIGDQATVQTGDANDPIHRYELIGDDLDGGTYDTPAENLANWRRIVTLDADGEIKGPLLHRFVLDTDDTDVARIGEIVCVVDDLDNPTTASYRMGDGTTKTANLPEIATVTP